MSILLLEWKFTCSFITKGCIYCRNFSSRKFTFPYKSILLSSGFCGIFVQVQWMEIHVKGKQRDERKVGGTIEKMFIETLFNINYLYKILLVTWSKMPPRSLAIFYFSSGKIFVLLSGCLANFSHASKSAFHMNSIEMHYKEIHLTSTLYYLKSVRIRGPRS